MRIVFMGTPDFAVPCLRNLVKAGHDIVHVITQPDRPKGRGHKMAAPPVKEAAIELGLPVCQPEKVKTFEVVNLLKELNPELVVVVAFGQILSKEILEIPRYGCLNVHASILPKYRGAAPIHWAIINGEKESGVSIMYMDEGLDTGDVLLVKKVSIEHQDTTGILHDKLAALGAEAIVEAIEKILAGQAERTPQEHEKSNYARLLDKKVELIDWRKSSKDVRNLIRGLNPWPGAFTYIGSKVLKIWEAAETDFESDAILNKVNPGEIIGLSSKGITVATGDGALMITELQLQGSKRMKAADFARGRNIEPGQVLG